MLTTAFGFLFLKRLKENHQLAQENHRLKKMVVTEGSSLAKISFSGTPPERLLKLKALMAKHIDPQRLLTNDRLIKKEILIDGQQQKRLCQLWQEGQRHYIGLEEDGQWMRYPINDIEDLEWFENQLLDRLEGLGCV
ncbi:hypothetical protein PEPS_45020 (plasmid) [Persicobacter psychrovividus]|uniref:Uncharacterized protein n=1 Tax=Persicobacter psychrovividus TaxID=387638 RepID=A0ABN6LKT9_9BACT|nr:hypothetical protein PEPS_45020 [Persicobacter psychrovividus]